MAKWTAGGCSPSSCCQQVRPNLGGTTRTGHGLGTATVDLLTMILNPLHVIYVATECCLALASMALFLVCFSYSA